jgi:hypothetical protein
MTEEDKGMKVMNKNRKRDMIEDTKEMVPS